MLACPLAALGARTPVIQKGRRFPLSLPPNLAPSFDSQPQPLLQTAPPHPPHSSLLNPPPAVALNPHFGVPDLLPSLGPCRAPSALDANTAEDSAWRLKATREGGGCRSPLVPSNPTPSSPASASSHVAPAGSQAPFWRALALFFTPGLLYVLQSSVN